MTTAQANHRARKTLYSGMRFLHHQRGSGYDLVVPDGAPHVNASKIPWLGTQPDSSRAFRMAVVLAELLTIVRGLFADTIHYYYPETTCLFSAPILSKLGKQIVFTIHLADASWLKGELMGRTFPLKRWCITHADILVTLSSAQQRSLAGHFPAKKVVFVPHGFLPEPAPLDKVRVLQRRSTSYVVLSGINYRDFEFIERALSARPATAPCIHMMGIGKKQAAYFKGKVGVKVHDRLADEDYRTVFEGALCLLLPLTFSSANNALLEAHKWGVPAVCTNITGVSDYATPTTSLFGSVAEFWESIAKLQNESDDSYLSRCFQIQQDATKAFSWETIREKLNLFFQSSTR